MAANQDAKVLGAFVSNTDLNAHKFISLDVTFPYASNKSWMTFNSLSKLKLRQFWYFRIMADIHPKKYVFKGIGGGGGGGSGPKK